MSKFPDAIAALAILAGTVLAAGPAIAGGDAAKGEKVFARCKACHAVGENAKNRMGPQLNDLFGRTAGSLPDYKYSKAMKAAGEGGLAWDDETLAEFLASPRAMVKGTKMGFAGLKKDKDVANLLAYLKSHSADAEAAPATEKKTESTPEPEPGKQAMAKPIVEPDKTPAIPVKADEKPHGILNLGRRATADEIAAWNIDVRPDGLGLPVGSGTVAEGDVLYSDNCASCHGTFGEAIGRWPVLAGGQGTLMNERPVKTIGSYWPYLSTVYDYVRRAMPFGNARSLSDDDVYALTAYLLYLNDIVTEEDFELSNENFTSIRLPNEANFIEDNRTSEPHYADKSEPCMKDCFAEPAKVSMRAAVLDVTPDVGEEGEGAGSVD